LGALVPSHEPTSCPQTATLSAASQARAKLPSLLPRDAPGLGCRMDRCGQQATRPGPAQLPSSTAACSQGCAQAGQHLPQQEGSRGSRGRLADLEPGMVWWQCSLSLKGLRVKAQQAMWGVCCTDPQMTADAGRCIDHTDILVLSSF